MPAKTIVVTGNIYQPWEEFGVRPPSELPGTDPGPGVKTITCLLTTGITLDIPIYSRTTFRELYAQVWRCCQNLPLFAQLGSPNEYNAYYFTETGEERQGGLDEVIQYLTHPPLLDIVRFEKPSSRHLEHARLGKLLDCEKDELEDLISSSGDSVDSPAASHGGADPIIGEVDQFRATAKDLAMGAFCTRAKRNLHHPNRPLHFLKTSCPLVIPDEEFTFDVDFKEKIYQPTHLEVLHISGDETESFIIPDLIFAQCKVSDVLRRIAQFLNFVYDKVETCHYVLKIFGYEIYLTSEVLLIKIPQFRRQLAESSQVKLVLLEASAAAETYNYSLFDKKCSEIKDDPSLSTKFRELRLSSPTDTRRRPSIGYAGAYQGSVKEWIVDSRENTYPMNLGPQEVYSFLPIGVVGLTEVQDSIRQQTGRSIDLWVGITACIVFGNTVVDSYTFPAKKTHSAMWLIEETAKTSIPISSLPRNATLCCVVHISKTEKPTSNTPLDYVKKFWVNTCLFDCNDNLKTGEGCLYLWELPPEQMAYENRPYLLGSTVNNFKMLKRKQGFWLHVSYVPDIKKAKRQLCFQKQLLEPPNLSVIAEIPDPGMVTLDTLINVEEASVEEQAFLLKEAAEFFLFTIAKPAPSMFADRPSLSHWLPQLAKCINYADPEMVKLFKQLMKRCPAECLKTDQCLTLLDFHSSDPDIRSFAVEQLQKKPIHELKRYLLQINECLKFERYLWNDLTRFLLEKCFEDHSFAHGLFWLLRASLHEECNWLRSCLIIEALFVGAPDYIIVLERELQAIHKLKDINLQLKTKFDNKYSKQDMLNLNKDLEDSLFRHQNTLSDILSPLNAAHRLSNLEVNKCKGLSSKMKPFWLCYYSEDERRHRKTKPTPRNPSPIFELTYQLIFKVGDDLRQDMLILQMFQCFNNLWLEEGLDLKLLPYRCTVTDLDSGLIEAVQHAKTISKIHKWFIDKRGRGGIFSGSLSAAFYKEAIYQWLISNEGDQSSGGGGGSVRSNEKKVEEFFRSCVGSCVAAYVLGIGDRHSDNIMIETSGRLFHIDFGHILGRRKSKFGINRERVALILPCSFMYIINHDFEGKDRQNSEYRKNFSRFEQLCTKAFHILRDNVDMICNILFVMINSGMPELRSIEDVTYVRDTLFVSDSREEATRKFHQKIQKSIQSAWTTEVNWALHNKRHWNAAAQ